MTDPEEPLEGDVPAEPVTAGPDDLREAVGVRRLTDPAPAPVADPVPDADADPDADDEEGARKPRGRWPLVAAVALLAGGFLATLVLLGRSNASRYVFHCGEQKITAEQGRGFPPWGSERLGGAEWKPIEIPPGAECQTRETDDRAELEQWFLDALVEQAQTKLTAKEVTKVDRAQAELEQALLLSRDPDRRDQRKEIDRLLGDVEYWRGAARVKAALETLEEAAKRYDAAADKRPRHASDAAAWAQWLREVAAGLRKGPAGLKGDAPVGPGEPPRPQAPTGVALPVEEPGVVDAAPITAPIDAGIPRGGVLL